MIINDRTFVPDALQGCLIGAASCFVARVTPRLKAFDLRRRRSEPLRCLAHVAAIRTRWAVGRAHRPRGRPGKDDRGGPGAGWESSLEAGRARHGPPPGPRHRRGKGACHRRRSARSPSRLPHDAQCEAARFSPSIGMSGTSRRHPGRGQGCAREGRDRGRREGKGRLARRAGARRTGWDLRANAVAALVGPTEVDQGGVPNLVRRSCRIACQAGVGPLLRRGGSPRLRIRR